MVTEKKEQKTKEKKGYLEDSVKSYYDRVAGTLKENFESLDDRRLFVKNVFAQLETELLQVCQNRHTSAIVENLIHLAESEQIIKVMRMFSDDWSVFVKDRFASFTVQTTVLRAYQILQTSKKPHAELITCIRDLFEFFADDLDTYIEDTSACAVLCTLVHVCAGVNVPQLTPTNDEKKTLPSKQLLKVKAAEVRDKPCPELVPLVDSLCNKISEQVHLSVYLTNANASKLFQSLLLVTRVRSPEMCDRLCSTILPLCTDLRILMSDVTGSHVLEQLFLSASDELFQQLYSSITFEQIKDLASHSSANFVVQKLIDSLRNPEQFESLYEELGSDTEALLADRCFGVVVSLVKGAQKHGIMQKKILKRLMKVFHCYEPKSRQLSLVLMLATLSTYDYYYKLPQEEGGDDEEGEESKEKKAKAKKVAAAEEARTEQDLSHVDYHGSVILQTLLQFKDTSFLEASFLHISTADLLFLMCHKFGGHVVDVFLQSQSVSEKSKAGLIKKLKGSYVDLVCDASGSHVFEKIWERAKFKDKLDMSSELVAMTAKVKGHRIGKIVWNKLRLNDFIHKRKMWENAQRGSEIQQSQESTSPKQTASPKKRKKVENEDDNETKDIESESTAKGQESKTKKPKTDNEGADKTKDKELTPKPKRPSKRQRMLMKRREQGKT